MRPNPPAECVVESGVTTCKQDMDIDEGDAGSFGARIDPFKLKDAYQRLSVRDVDAYLDKA